MFIRPRFRLTASQPIFVAAALLATSCAPAGIEPDLGDAGEVDAVSQAVTAQPDPSCSWAQFNGHDYWFCTATKSWADAQAVCSSVNMHLARMDTDAENVFARSKLGSNAWLGGRDLVTEGQWRWVDNDEQFWNGLATGSTVAGRYARFRSGEPNNSLNEDCAEMRASDGFWNDTQCALARSFVCESSAATAAAPLAPDTACTRKTRNGKAYWVCNNDRNWDVARANCQAIGMDLTSIDDADEAEFVKGAVTKNSHIGLSDRSKEGVWRWSQSRELGWCGTALGRVPTQAYSNWAVGQPFRDNVCANVEANQASYWFCSNDRTWTGARDECAGANMSLAKISSQAENDLLATGTIRDSWLGANDIAQEGRWHWLDNQQFWQGAQAGSVSAGQYARWGINEPNNVLNEDCASYEVASRRWRDLGCGNLQGWVCEGPMGSDHPDRNDCAWVHAYEPSYPAGEWFAGDCAAPRAYVCESVPAVENPSLDAAARAVREDFLSGKPRVGHVDLRTTLDAAKLFLRDDARFGLRACVDTLEPTGARRTDTYWKLDKVEYAQRYKGVPVHGRGYWITLEPGTGRATEISGRIEHDIEAATDALVPEPAALLLAAAAVGGNPLSFPSVPRATLELFPTAQGKTPSWELAWLFSLPAVGNLAAQDVVLSARTGKILHQDDGVQTECSSARLPLATNTINGKSHWDYGPIDVQAFQQRDWGDPSTAQAIVNSADQTHPYLLATRGMAAGTNQPWATSPDIYTYCDPDMLSVASVPSATTASVDDLPPDDDYAAAVFLAAQTCIKGLGQQVDFEPGNPWLGMDGLGIQPIDLLMFPNPNLPGGGPHYNSATHAIYVPLDSVRGEGFLGAAVETVCHELGHGVWDLLAGGILSSPEGDALNEGFGDIVASAVEMAARGYPGPNNSGWCFLGDRSRNQTCDRDMAEPHKSVSHWCHVEDRSGNTLLSACPSDYDGPDYCTSDLDCNPSNDPARVGCCEEHRNSTPFSHWFYLIATGDDGVNQSQCRYRIEPLDRDLSLSVQKAMKITFLGMRDYVLSPSSGYVAMADATISAARKLYGPGSAEARSVVAAWYAVNVRENFSEDMNTTVNPRRSEENVYPWTTFEWPAFANETAWDFKLWDPLLVQKEANGITGTVTRGGVRYGQFEIALGENTRSRYFWQVRPAGGDSWDCYPIHSFLNTGEVEKIDGVEFIERVDGQGKPRPGLGLYRWDVVKGAKQYRVFVSKSESCTPVPGDITSLVAHDPSVITADGKLGWYVEHLDPDEAYYVHVTPIGPATATGVAATGTCKVHAFRTAPMRAPDIGSPFHQSNIWYHDPVVWYLNARDEPDSLVFRAYLRAPNNSCGATPVLTQTAPRPACLVGYAYGIDDCVVEVPSTLPTSSPNPSGYCWEVVAVNNGKSSPAARAAFEYALEPGRGKMRWGQRQYDALRWKDNAVLTNGQELGVPGDSYGKPVEIGWQWLAGSVTPRALTDDFGFVVKLGRWPWNAATARDPLNCDLHCRTVQVGFCDNRPPGQQDPGGCLLGPAEVTFDTRRDLADGVAHGRTLSVPAEKGGMGRYCYEVWPVLAAPGNANVAAPFQPFVNTSSSGPTCYTTGPSAPLIWFDNPPTPGAPFNTTPITGTIKLAYVPDGQFTVEATPAADIEFVRTSTGALCPIADGSAPYADVRDCTITFTIRPKTPNTDYSIRVRTYNSQAKPNPVMDEASKVHDDERGIRTGTCGGPGEACCANNRCNNPEDFQCGSDQICRHCGASGEQCCNQGPQCDGSSLRCDGSICTRKQPDLVTTGCSYDRVAGILNIAVKNQGDAEAPKDWKVFLQADAGSLGWSAMTTLTATAFSAGDVGGFPWFFTLPNNIAKAPLNVRIFLDSSEVVDESDETNNIDECFVPGVP